MRREARRKKEDNFNTLIYISGGILVIAIIAFIVTFIMYSNKLKDQQISIETEKLSQIVPNDEEEESTAASTQIGKTVEESANDTNNTEEENIENKQEENTTNNNVSEDNKTANNTSNVEKEEEKKELEFGIPIEGEITKEFAKDNLIYSETLKEWVTHLGIDIKAEQASVVKASESGKISSIKNDPRYGLTVIIEHDDGYKTVYSNLLTTEFVEVGEEVEKGQTIATVGSSAAFEIADESHLHFEILKDNVYVNPTDLIDF